MSIKSNFIKKYNFSLRTKYSLQIIFMIIFVSSSLVLIYISELNRGMINIKYATEKLAGEALLAQMKKKAEVIVATLSHNLVNPLYYMDIESINALLRAVKTQSDVDYIYLYDPDGKIITDGSGVNILADTSFNDEISRKAVESKDMLLQIKRNILDASMPIYLREQKLGGIRVGFSFEQIYAEILREREHIAGVSARTKKNTLIFSLLISTILTLWGTLFALIIAKLLVRPILILTKGARRVSKGDFQTRVDIKSGDELEELADSFNQMTLDLKKSRDEIENYSKTLEQKVEERTEQLKEAQGQLVQTAKMAAVGQLAAGAAHEINNPLGGILGYAQLILSKVDKPDSSVEDLYSCRQYVEHIERESKRCKNIIESLLTFSRRSSEKFGRQNIKSIIENTLSVMRYSLERHNIKLNAEFQTEIPPVIGNADQLQQVFTNLIVNAQQAMPGGGELDVSLEVVDEGKNKNIRIRFKDNGLGIPRDNLERIFEPFFTTKQDWKSIGLGLSICYQIIEQHGGKILAESEVGKGSIFTVGLPCEP